MTHSPPEPPLFVDLDGTIIATDITWESIVDAYLRPVVNILRIPFWYLQGRPFLKRRISETSLPDPESLPYYRDVLDWLRKEKTNGRQIILASASDIRQVNNVAAYLGLFDEVIATDGESNLKGEKKLEVMRAYLDDPEMPFDYAGDSSADLPIWKHAREAIVVRASNSVLAAARKTAKVTRVFEKERLGNAGWSDLLGVRSWAWNLLIFLIPLVSGFTTRAIGIPSLIAGPLTLVALTAISSICSSVFFIQEDRKANIDSPVSTGNIKISSGLKALLGLSPVVIALGFMAFPPAFVLLGLPVFVLLSIAARRNPIGTALRLIPRLGIHVIQILAGYMIWMQ